jgi:hypothetical protein
MSEDGDGGIRLARLVEDLLDRDYERQTRQVLTAIASRSQEGVIARRLTELDEEAERLREAGERLQPDNAVLRALLADMQAELDGAATLLDEGARNVERGAIDAAGRLQRQLALPGLSDARLRALGITWNRPDPEAVAAVVNYTNSDNWRRMVERYPSLVLDTARNQAIRGIAEGWNPLRTARRIREVSEGLPAHIANAQMRTLQGTAYRDATAIHQRENLHILEGQIRIAALDDRTCLACIALHGTALPAGERVDDHHAGRCTGVGVVRGRERTIMTGEEWFNSLPPERQRRIAGVGNYEALRAGRVRLRDFVQEYQDPDGIYGRMIRQGSIAFSQDAAQGRRELYPLWTGERAGQVGDLDAVGSETDLIEWMRQNEDTALGRQFWDETMALVDYDDDWNLRLQPENIRNAARVFVRESQDIQYSRDYIVDLMIQQAQERGVRVENPEEFFNQQYSYQARAILRASDLANVRLTEAQNRRLNTALRGGYLDMVYTTDSSEAGSLANAVTRRSPQRLSGTELEQARENFRNWVLGQD